MVQIGMAVFALGFIALVYGFMQKLKAGRVMDAPLVSTRDAATRGSEVASPKGAISAQGKVVCPQPLVSPFTGTPCLWYRIKCTAAWKEGERHKTKELDDQKVAAAFTIDDGSGPVHVDAREGGDFEPSQSRKETKGTGLLGGIAGGDIMFGNYRVTTGMLSLGTKYTVEEQVMPLQPELYVCGKAGPGAIVPPSWRQLIMSNKKRDELLAAATIGAKRFLLGGAIAFATGLGVAIVGQLIAKPEAEAATIVAAPTASAIATTTAAVTATATPTATASTAATTAGANSGSKSASAPTAKKK